MGKNILVESNGKEEDGAGGELDGYFDSPEANPPKWMGMIRAYLDESGQESKDYVVLAGHVGYSFQWKRFVPAWQAALGPQRKRLHMNSLRFKKARDKKLLAGLGVIPTSCELKRLIGGVRVSDYKDLIPDPLRVVMGG